MTESISKQNPRIISIAVFVFALALIIINLVSLVFPSLIESFLEEYDVSYDPFELGTWAIPVIITNLAMLVFGIFYFTNKLPSVVQNGISFIKNFEVSRNVTAIVLVGLVFGYIGFSFQELPVEEGKTYGDFERVKAVVEAWPFGNVPGEESLFNLHVKNFLLKSSQFLFQNYRVMPFIISISLLVLTYFFTAEITKKRFAGIVALIILLQSDTFQAFDTSASYENSWTLFYLLSLYLIEKRWFLSPLAYVASLFSKPLTAPYLPMTLFYTYNSQISRRKKFYTLLIYIAIIFGGLVGLYVLGIDVGGGISQGKLDFEYIDFWNSFTTWSYQLRFDGIFLLFILPLAVALFFTAKNGVLHADSLLALIAGAIISMSLLVAFTGFNLHPYRYMPLIVFFAVGVGMLLSKRSLDGSKNGTG